MNNTRISNVLAIFYLSLLLPNFISFFLVLISSQKSCYGTYYSFEYIGLYLLIVGAAISFSYFLIDFNRKIIHIDINYFISSRIFIILVFLLVVGIFLHIYDKVEIRGYNYLLDSIRTIRAEWLNDGTKRNSIASSWQSAFGYLFTFLYFIVMHIAIVANIELINKFNYIIVFISTLIIIILSYTIGARSVILFALVYIIAIYLLLFIYNRHKQKIKLLIPILLAFILYIIFITYIQIYGINKHINFNAYISGYNKELMVKTNNSNHINHQKQTDNKIHNVISLAILYANHGIYNFEYTLHQKEHPGLITLSSIVGILNKLHIMNTKYKTRTYGKGMISAFGAIWYDFGTTGFIIFALFHTFLFVIVSIGLASKNILINILSQLSFVFLIILNIFSPLVLATNLMIAPGLIMSYIILFFIVYTNVRIKKYTLCKKQD